MDINAEVSTQLSLIDVLLCDLDKKPPPCTDKKHEKKEEETQAAMPDSTTHTEKANAHPFHCGDDVLVPNKDGRYYLGTIVELSTSNDNDLCEVGAGVARCLVKFGDGTHAWAPLGTLRLLSAPPADERVMCVVCKRRDAAAAAVVACDMCGRGYHAQCHSPPVDAWVSGASWHCKRCVAQRYRAAAAESRALRRSDPLRARRRQDLAPPCDTASTTSSAASDAGGPGPGLSPGGAAHEAHCYCGEKSDWLAQMLLCCRCSQWFHQRCVTSLQYPLYAGDKLYIFACAACNPRGEFLRRLELCWLDLAHLVLYNLTAYNAPNYFDLDEVVMPYITDNWHALQLPEKMWRTPAKERRERILTALTSSRKRFKCGREMKKRATIWGLRLRRPPPQPPYLAALTQVKKGESLTDELVRSLAPRLRFLPRAESPPPPADDGFQPSSSKNDKSSYKSQQQRMIVPVDGHWLNLMMGKRFHENLNSNSENDSTSSYELGSSGRKPDAKDDCRAPPANGARESPPRDEPFAAPVPSPVLASLPPNCMDDAPKEPAAAPTAADVAYQTHRSRIATMNMEVSKMSTTSIIEHSKIMSLQHMGRRPRRRGPAGELDSSGDENSTRGTLDAFIPHLKDFQGKNNPFLMKPHISVKAKLKGKNGRCSLPCLPTAPLVKPLKRKLSEKDIVVGPNGEVKRRKFRRSKYIQMQLNNSCPLPDESSRSSQPAADAGGAGGAGAAGAGLARGHGRRLRQRQEKNYYENARRSTAAGAGDSVRSLQLSPHKADGGAAQAQQLSVLKSTVQSYFRAGQTFHVLARRRPDAPGQASYLIQWDSGAPN